MSEEDYGGARPPTFSQRYGYTEYSTAILHRSLDERTRVNLWNLIEQLFLNFDSPHRPLVRPQTVWTGYLTQIHSGYSPTSYRKKLFDIVFDGEWYHVYDLIQALLQYTDEAYQQPFAESINSVLTLKRAGCRVVETSVTEITEEAEVQGIENAIKAVVFR